MHQFHGRVAFVALGLIGVLLAPVAPAVAQSAADNTKVNTRDRAKGAVTADQQAENGHDREITRQIRRALVGDKTLSTYAHNVKIVARDGQVTLKGPVRTSDEKKRVEEAATTVAGAGRVTSQISIAPKGAQKHRGELHE